MIEQEESTTSTTDNIQSEKIKLIKNTKGFNWEITILSTDVERVWKLNDEMEEKYKKTKGDLL